MVSHLHCLIETTIKISEYDSIEQVDNVLDNLTVLVTSHIIKINLNSIQTVEYDKFANLKKIMKHKQTIKIA